MIVCRTMLKNRSKIPWKLNKFNVKMFTKTVWRVVLSKNDEYTETDWEWGGYAFYSPQSTGICYWAPFN